MLIPETARAAQGKVPPLQRPGTLRADGAPDAHGLSKSEGESPEPPFCLARPIIAPSAAEEGPPRQAWPQRGRDRSSVAPESLFFLAGITATSLGRLNRCDPGALVLALLDLFTRIQSSWSPGSPKLPRSSRHDPRGRAEEPRREVASSEPQRGSSCGYRQAIARVRS